MAKWGEGDPRWIVEERPDATNVNNWHWVEKDATGWSRDKLKDLFVGLKIENEKGFCEILELTKTEGEASANNRKAKLIFFYEWVIAGTWEGKLTDSQKKIKGKFEIPNLSEENEPSEIDIMITTEKETQEASLVKEIMRSTGVEIIRMQIEKYIKDLKDEYSQGIILPSRNGNIAPAVVDTKNKENTAKAEMNKVVQTSTGTSGSSAGVRIPTTTVTMKEKFKCTLADLYRALTVKGIPEKKLSMRWRMKTWPDEHYSVVTIELEEADDCTRLTLKQTGIPAGEVDRTKEGWQLNFWQRIKQAFGFEARLY
ncbi:activator of 90 kDa heat shock protein ATPase homolog 1-like isoform X2 [Pomacea canaliculata]|uniref:activator of 90 kDa heat shock protein ATPase homolog 1-like isoform X2 n=1 Tax=Pomacea canaliculata TaxID=400727 RepID=UPI000D739214|nr:activator of 90 kDa heat shock protein ATPase homolog 1-like isoform X2 [Pomacea canaliculata]